MAWNIAWARWRALPLPLDWLDSETVLLGQRNTCVMTHPHTVKSLYMRCDLAANANVMGNVRNCLLCAMLAEGHFCLGLCYEPWQRNWLPMCWREFKHVYVVITDGHGQKVPFEGRTGSVKLLLRQKGGYLWFWKRKKRQTDIIIIMVASIPPHGGALYQWGHGPSSIFKGLSYTAIPFLKDPVLWAIMHIASDMLRGKNMKQALKNWVEALLGDLMQAVGVEPAAPARKRATHAKQCSKHPVMHPRTQKRPRQGDIFA